MGHQRKSPFEKVTEALGSETVPSAAQWNELLGRLGRCRLSWNPKANHLFPWMEMVISNHLLYKDLVHHPIETTIYKWLALGFQD